ncbi:MAG: DNA polymerase IV [Candidatus Izemoplasmataceae bacterium]
MKKYRIIFHVDLNAFYASCEEAVDPSLKSYPIGIAKNSDRGILTTANYEARKFGVSSAMNVYEAKKRCPHIKIVPPNFSLYESYSEQFFAYLRTFTNQIEPASIDEGYLDLTDDLNGKHPLDIAKEIQKTLLDEYKLPVSIGIAPNMFLAKMASDMKKPLGITILRKRDIKEKLWPLPIEKMFGIGKKTVPNLKLLGIHTIKDLATYSDTNTLSKFLGNQTESFIQKAHGHDTRSVDPSSNETISSIGNSRTYEGYLHSFEACEEALTYLTNTVYERLVKHERSAKTIAVSVRYNDFENHSKHFSFEYHTQSFELIKEVVDYLFDELYNEKPVHLLGVSLSNLKKQTQLFRQLTIFESDTPIEKETHIDKLLKSINENYDNPLLKKGLKE